MTAVALCFYWLDGDTYGDFTLRGKRYVACPVNHANRMAFIAGAWVRFTGRRHRKISHARPTTRQRLPIPSTGKPLFEVATADEAMRLAEGQGSEYGVRIAKPVIIGEEVIFQAPDGYPDRARFLRMEGTSYLLRHRSGDFTVPKIIDIVR